MVSRLVGKGGKGRTDSANAKGDAEPCSRFEEAVDVECCCDDERDEEDYCGGEGGHVVPEVVVAFVGLEVSHVYSMSVGHRG